MTEARTVNADQMEKEMPFRFKMCFLNLASTLLHLVVSFLVKTSEMAS